MKSLKKLMMICLSSSFVGCAMNPPNIELCGKLSWGATCRYTLSGETRDMHEMEWSEVGRVSMSLEDFGEVKKFILESCKRSRKCEIKDDEEFEEVEDFIEGFEEGQ